MSYRFMRLLVMFDLPTETSEDRRAYQHFRKALIAHGFLMLQESVYCRLLLTPSAKQSAMEAIRKAKPKAGSVMALSVTEKQFAAMEFLVGAYHSEVLDTDERLVIL